MRKVMEGFKRGILKEILEWIVVIIISFAVAYTLKNYVIETTKILGISMQDTFKNGDKLFINRFIYKIKTPQRGDVVVFLPDNAKKNYIKRIIGLPGEEINIKEGKVIINGIELDEKYAKGKTMLMTKGKVFPYILDEDEYFVLGDNRFHSEDSRMIEIGKVTLDKIRGKAFMRIYPFDRFGMIKKENYDN